MQTDKVIILNNEARMISIQVTHNDPAGRLDLKPDTNEVDRDLWEKAKTLKSVQVWMTTKSTSPDVFNAPMLQELEGLPALDVVGAEKVLHRTFDKALLTKWDGEEKRDDVRLAIKRRIDEIATIETQALEEAAAKAKAEALGGDGDGAPTQHADAPHEDDAGGGAPSAATRRRRGAAE